jgi:hypothetical protein
MISVIVSHYPPYASNGVAWRWNPIEHRLFSHIRQAMGGVMLDKYKTIKKLIEQICTRNKAGSSEAEAETVSEGCQNSQKR